MTAELIDRLEKAASVYDECDALQNAVDAIIGGSLTGQRLALTDIVRSVRMGRAPRAVLVGVAAALVPKDAFWRVGHDGEGPNPGDFRADVLLPLPAEGRSISGAGVAATAPLALCIAALRARLEDTHDR